MIDAFIQLISSLSVYAAAISILLTLTSLWFNIRNIRTKLKGADEVHFQKVLDSDDINTLGKYLDGTLGNFNIYEYTSNFLISERVDKYIERIKQFVGTVDDMKAQEAKLEPEVEASSVSDRELPDDFKPILNELRTGEAWNALARLRRLIEIKFRQFAEEIDLPQKRLRSAGYILRIFEKELELNKNLVSMLSYAISVCNKAIHGTDVLSEEAEEAIFVAAKALPEIERNIRNSRTKR